LPHVKSNRRKGRASRKNQTIGEEKTDNTGITYYRSTYGVDFERRKKLTRLTAKKYQQAPKPEKTKISDTFTVQTGYDRKYAIRILVNGGVSRFVNCGTRLKASRGSGGKRVRPRVYDDAVGDALIPIWDAFNRQCGKLLASFLHVNMAGIRSGPC
jgi:hypothetical protein